MTGELPRLLVVDDEQDIRFLTRTILQDDFDVVEAAGGAEALEMLRGDAGIILVLLDIRMPDVDGFAVLGSLVAMEMLDRLSVVAFSAHADPKVAERIIDSGAIALVHKPFGSDELVDALQDALALHRRGQR